MSDQTVSVTVKGIGDFSDVVSSVGSVQKALTKLKLPDKLGDNLNKNITAFYKEYEKYQKKIGEGIKTQGDYNQVEKSLNNMRNLYQAIGKDAQKLTQLDMTDMLKLDTGEFKKIIDEMTSIMKQIGNVKIDTAPFTKALKDIQGITKNSKITGENGLLSQIIGNINTGKITEAKEALKELEDYAKRVAPRTITTTDEKGNKIERQAPGTINSDKYQKLTGAIDGMNAAIARADSALDPLIAKHNNLQKELDETKQKASQSIKKNFGDYNQASGEVEKLTDSLKRMHQEEFGFNRQVQDIDRQIQSYFGLSQMIRKVGDIAREAFNTVKELDAAMVETAVVTNFDVGDMWNMLPTYTEQANQLGATIKDVYEAATLYYQQGLNTNQAMGLANETLKMARIAGLDAADATNMMTAALRGFNMEINQASAQKINDIYSELAAITASDTKEIGSAMERTASIANSANMDFATTSAFLAQMIETTREAPENLGTAMKTIVARFQEMKQDPTKLVDSEGVAMDANKVDAALKTIGVNLTNTRGEFRNLDEVFLDISARWDSLTQGQQRYIATIAAGSRQQSRFIAMMSDYDRTMELVDAANNSAGASQKQFEKTLDSMSTKLNQLKNAWDQFTMGLMNNQIIKFGIDALTEGFTIINKFIDLLSGKIPDPFGGLTKSALTLTATLAGLNFGKKFARGSIMAGVGWWKGEGKFTDNFAKGFGPPKTRNRVDNSQKDLRLQAQQQVDKKVNSRIVDTTLPVKIKTVVKDIDTTTLGPKTKQALKEKVAELEKEVKSGSLTTVDAKIKFKAAAEAEGLHANTVEKLTSGFDAEFNKIDGATPKVEAFGNKVASLGSNLTDTGVALTEFGNKLGNPLGSVLSSVGSLLTNFGTTLQSIGIAFVQNYQSAVVAAVGEEAFAAGEVEATVAANGLKTALISTLGPLALIIAAVAGAVVVYKALDAAHESAKERMERMTDAAAKASEAYDSAKQETSELADAISQIQDNDNAFNNLVAGTAEFNEKLVEANQKITELINKYPMLNDPKYLSTDKNGLMHITQAGLDYVKEYQKQRQSNAAALNALQTAQLTSEENKQKAGKLRQGNIFGTETGESYKKRIQEAEYLEKSAEAAEKVAQQTAISSVLSGEEIKNREKIASIYASSYDEAVKQVDTTKMSIDEMRQAYADFYGYTYNKSTKEMTDVEGNVVLTKDDDQIVKDAIPEITVLTNFEANGASLDKMIGTIDQKFNETLGKGFKNSGSLFSDILSRNIETNEDDLKKLMQDPSKIEEAIKELDSKEIAAILGISEEQVAAKPEEFTKQLTELTESRARDVVEAQATQYKDLATMMAEASGLKAENFGVVGQELTKSQKANQEAIISKLEELKQEQKNTLTTVGTALKNNMGTDAMSSFIDNATSIYLQKGKEGKKAIQDLNNAIEGVNWDSSISRLQAFKTMADSNSDSVKKMGEELLNSTDSVNLATSAFTEFYESSDWTDLSENMDKFVDSSGKLNATSIEQMSGECRTLKELLDTGAVSAGGVAAALNAMGTDGNLTIMDLNDSLLNFLSTANQLEDVLASAHNIIENFDWGVDTGESEDFAIESTKKWKELYDNGEFGNQQLENYAKFVLGQERWNEELENSGGNIEKALNNMSKDILKYSDGFEQAWVDMANSDKSKYKDVHYGDNGDIIWETNGKTTEELVQWLSKTRGITEEWAKLMVEDFANYSYDFKTELAKNDYNAAIKNGDYWKDRQNADGSVSMTQSELENLASATGKKVKEVTADMAESLGLTTDEFQKQVIKNTNKNGELLMDAASIKKINKQYNQQESSDKNAKQPWINQYQAKDANGDIKKNTVDLKDAIAGAVADNFNLEQATEMARIAAKEEYNKNNGEVYYNGVKLKKEDLENEQSFAEAVERITDESKWTTIGDIIGQKIVEAWNNKDQNNLPETETPSNNNPPASNEGKQDTGGGSGQTPTYDYTETDEAAAKARQQAKERIVNGLKNFWQGIKEAASADTQGKVWEETIDATKKNYGNGEKATKGLADGLKGIWQGIKKAVSADTQGKLWKETTDAAEKNMREGVKKVAKGAKKGAKEGSAAGFQDDPKNSPPKSTKETTTTKKDSSEKTTVESKEEVTVTYKANTDELDLAKEKIQSTIKAAEEGAVLTVTAKTGGTFKTVGESISNLKDSTKGSVKVGSKVTGVKDVKELTTAIGKVKAKSVNVKANVTGLTAVANLKTSIDNLKDKDIYITTYKRTKKDGDSDAKGKNNKISYSPLPQFGSAANGRYGRVGPKGKGGLTLTGEKGFEIAWLPSESRSMILGADGPQMINLPSDAVVYTHEQSKDILKQRSIPAGSHAGRHVKNSGSLGDADDSGNSGSSGGSSKKSKPKKGGGSKLIIKSIKLVDKAGKITNWWENISRRVDGAQRQVDKALKNFNKVVNIAGTNFKTVSANANTYIKKLNLSKSLNQQIVDKYTKSLKQLDKGTGKQSKRNSIAKKYNNTADKVAKAEAKVETVKGKNAKKSAKKQLKQAKKQLKNATKGVNKSPSIQVVSWKDTAIVTTKKGGKIKKVKKQVTRQKAIDYSKLIKYDAATDTYILDDKKINKLYGSNKKTAKAVKEKGNKLIDEKIQRRNTAQDKVDDAREALDKLADDVYNMFNRWEKSLTEVYLISQQIATLQGKKNIYDSQEEYISSKLLAGYSNTTDGLAKLTQVLENRRKNLVETAKANSNLIESSYKNYAAALDFNQYREQFMVGQKQGNSAIAETELAAATIAFKILREAGATSTDTYDPAKVEKAYQNYVKQNYTNETDNEVKKVLDRIQDYQSSYYEAITDTYGSVTEIYSTLNEYRDYINDFEESLLKGMEEELNKEIDQLSKINSALTDGFKNLLDEVKTRLNERRQTEDNQKTETDISKKQQRLAALQADTSGGHAVEIAQLQKEIADAQQNYGRTLEDQLLDKLQKQGDEAAKQRERQIKLLEIQRDLAQATGTNLEEVKKLLEDPVANMDKLRELWLSNNNFDEALPGQQEKLLHEFEEAMTKYLAYSTEVGTLEQVLSKVSSTDAYQNQVVTSIQAIEDILKGLISNGIADPGITTTSLKSFKDAKMGMKQTVDAANAEGIEWNYKDLKNVGYKVKDFKDSGYDVAAVAKAGFGYNDIIGGGFTYNDILQQAGELSSINPQLVASAQKALKAEETAKELARIKQIEKEELKNAKNNYKNNKDNEKITTIDDNSAASKYYNFLLARGNKYDTGDKNWNKLGKDGYLAQVKRGQKLGYSEYKVASDLAATSAFTWEEILKVVAAAGRKGKIVKAWNPNAKADSGFRKAFEKIYGKWNKFASGGLANQTGPAWLDGTPSKPELVLNAKDTKNFIALKDVLSHIMSSANNLSDSYGGNATYEININVDHLNNDYDVDKVAERVKKKIVQDSGYRNVTQVRKFR